MQTGYTLCRLFATILFHCNPTSPGALWQEFRHYICDDLPYKLQNIHPNRDFTQDEVYDYGLHLIDHILQNWGSRLSEVAGMPGITGSWGVAVGGGTGFSMSSLTLTGNN